MVVAEDRAIVGALCDSVKEHILSNIDVETTVVSSTSEVSSSSSASTGPRIIEG